MNLDKLFVRRAKRGAIYKSAWGHFVINDKNGAEIIFDEYGLGVTFDGCYVIRVTLRGGGRYTADADIIHAYICDALRELSECFQSNADLGAWLHTVVGDPISYAGVRYALRIANDNYQACRSCAFVEINKAGFSVYRCANDDTVSCAREASKRDFPAHCAYFQRID